MSTASLLGTTSTSTLNSLLEQSWMSQADIQLQMRVRRMLVSRDRSAIQQNLTGTTLPPPFNNTSLAIRSMIGEASKSLYISASRLTANQPEISVIPLSTKAEIGATVEKSAGMQERFDEQMWHECGGPDAQWEAAWSKSLGGAAFWLTLPRDSDFGLPDRTYYDESDEEVAALKRDGKLSPKPNLGKRGQLIYAEHGDVWASRRKQASQERAVSGRSLFTLQVYPRDMVLKERDKESRDLKWAAIIEEIPSALGSPGSDFAISTARALGVKADDQGLWGIFLDSKTHQIVGGIPKGGPLNTYTSQYDAFTLIRFFNREEQIILVAPRGSVYGATEIWRGAHGCMVQGAPACPVVEDAFYRTDINVPGKEYATALDPVFGYVPQINQLMTILSNVAAYNGIPRMVMKVENGTTLRGDDGEPLNAESAVVPGLNPNEIAAYPGDVKQLVIDDESLRETLAIYFARLDLVVPAQGTDAGADAAGWAVQQRIQEGQQIFTKPVSNFCQAGTGIVQRWHSWLRDLDVPVYFFAAPGHRSSKRDIRGLIEIDPKNLTDSIRVTQGLDTPSEATVKLQVGMEQWQAGLIDDFEYYDKYAQEQDARDAMIRRYVQATVNYVVLGQMPQNYAPGGAIQPVFIQVADGVRGAVHYQLINESDNYAVAVARQMAGQALGGQQPGQPPVPGAPATSVPQNGTPTQGIAQAAGIRTPGLGMSDTLNGQLGARAVGTQFSNVVGPGAQ